MQRGWASAATLAVVALMTALTALASGVALPIGPAARQIRGEDGFWVPRSAETRPPAEVPVVPQPPPGDNAGGQVLTKLLVALVGLLVLALAAYVAYRLVARRPGRVVAAPAVQGLGGPPDAPAPVPASPRSDGASGSLAPDDAVVACWRRLEREAAARGVPRRRSQSSGDLVGAIRAAGPVDAPALRTLERAYSRAVYAGRGITDADAARARTALDAVFTGWGVR